VFAEVRLDAFPAVRADRGELVSDDPLRLASDRRARRRRLNRLLRRVNDYADSRPVNVLQFSMTSARR
jgi:hypothetical protein